MYLMGIDLGTTGCKSMIFDYRGRIISQSYIEYELIKIRNSYIEQDADLWWDMVQKSISQSILLSNISGDKIKALSVSSQGISFVPIDQFGNTLYNAISWLDTRPVEQTEEIRELLSDDEIFNTTGKRVSPVYTLPKLMWMKRNRPDVYHKTYKFLMGMDYITYKLTGKMITDYSMASGSMAFNVSSRKWDEEIIRKCGLDIEKLPEVRCTGSVVGKIRTEVAEKAGIYTDAFVVLGAQDQKCAAIGAGICQRISTVSLGTSTAICSIDFRPVFDEFRRIPCFALDDSHWILESVISTSGISLKWLKNLFCETMDYSAMDELAKTSTVGAGGVFFFPYLEGASSPFWRDDIKGFLYGFTLCTSKEDIVRSLMEGIAFQIRINVELHEEITQDRINEIRVFGGGSKSEFWCELIADVTGKTVGVLCTSEAANLGAAIIAGIGVGVYKNYDDAVANIQPIAKQIKPRKSANLEYDKIFKEFKTIQNKIFQ